MIARRLTVPAAAAPVVLVLLAGVSLASYRTLVAGTGTGTATPAPASPLTLTVTGIAGSGLYPNGPGADVTVTVANPYDQPITVTGISSAGSVAATPLAGNTCATTGVTVTPPASGFPFTVAANATSAGVTLPAVVKMDGSAESGCQGATFTVSLMVSGRL